MLEALRSFVDSEEKKKLLKRGKAILKSLKYCPHISFLRCWFPVVPAKVSVHAVMFYNSIQFVVHSKESGKLRVSTCRMSDTNCPYIYRIAKRKEKGNYWIFFSQCHTSKIEVFFPFSYVFFMSQTFLHPIKNLSVDKSKYTYLESLQHVTWNQVTDAVSYIQSVPKITDVF